MSFTNPDFMKAYFTLLNMEWSDYDDFERKYGSDVNPENAGTRFGLWALFDNLGYMARQGFIDLIDLYNLAGMEIVFIWAKYEPILKEQRNIYAGRDWMGNFEYLVGEILKIKLVEDPEYMVPETLSKYVPKANR
jgi:hypothetical protein